MVKDPVPRDNFSVPAQIITRLAESNKMLVAVELILAKLQK